MAYIQFNIQSGPGEAYAEKTGWERGWDPWGTPYDSAADDDI